MKAFLVCTSFLLSHATDGQLVTNEVSAQEISSQEQIPQLVYEPTGLAANPAEEYNYIDRDSTAAADYGYGSPVQPVVDYDYYEPVPYVEQTTEIDEKEHKHGDIGVGHFIMAVLAVALAHVLGPTVVDLFYQLSGRKLETFENVSHDLVFPNARALDTDFDFSRMFQIGADGLKEWVETQFDIDTDDLFL